MIPAMPVGGRPPSRQGIALALVSLVGALGLAFQGVGCVAAPIRDPSVLPHFEAQVRTDDGWTLSLFRIPPNPAAEGQAHYGTPLLLCHGTAVNRMNFLMEGSNLALFLSRAGFDVWLPELRGDRSSRAPEPRVWRRGRWNVDEMADRDIPVVLDHILQATGRSELYWVGHSLGGILGYLTLQGPRADQVAGIVAFGSPGGYPHPHRLALHTKKLRGLLPRLGQVPIRSLGRLGKGFVHLAPDAPLLHAIYNLDNSDPVALAAFIEPALENIAVGVIEQYRLWVDGVHLVSVDGRRDYTEGLARIEAPALLFTGRVDHIVPPWTVRLAYDRLASPDKTLIVLGRGWGTRHDYGHGDLVVGRFAEEEVFPLVRDWLVARTRGEATPVGDPKVAGGQPFDPLLDDSELRDEPDALSDPDAEQVGPEPGAAPVEGSAGSGSEPQTSSEPEREPSRAD